MEKHGCFNLARLPPLVHKHCSTAAKQGRENDPLADTVPSEISLVLLQENQNGFTMMMLINYTSQKQHNLDQHTFHDTREFMVM